MLPAYLTIHVASMCTSRATRTLLGFSLEDCIRLRIPPCRFTPLFLICVTPPLERALQWRTRQPQELFVYDPARSLTIYLEYTRYLRYEFSVVTNISLIATKERPEWIVNPRSQERTLWYNQGEVRVFGDETVGTFSYFSDTMPDFIYA